MKKIYAFLLMAVLMAAVSACSKDDEPGDYDSTYDGVAILMNAENTLYADGQPAFTPSETPGVYLAVAANQDKARAFIVQLIENPEWDGKDVTIKLGEKGESGSLKIVGGTTALLSRGIYNTIIVDINDYPPYTLEIITQEAADNGKGKDIVVIQ